MKNILHLPTPAPLCGADAGSFAEDTIVRRLPELVRRVLSENNFDPPAVERLQALLDDLPHGAIRPLQDALAPDRDDWQKALQPFIGRSWLEVPMFAAETIFYRRILEASGYFQPGPGAGVDPYRMQKELGLAQAGQALSQGLPEVGQGLSQLIHFSLWGNQADLSLWPVQGEGGGRAGGGGGEEHLLADASREVDQYIEGLDGGRVEFLLDNCGTELIIDLLLVDVLLQKNPHLTVRLIVKPHPVFVSDALVADVAQALHWLKTDAPAWAQPVGKRLEQAQGTGRIQMATHIYWASPSRAWEMPPDLRADLANSVLIISKGDVNYRRWLGDARWLSTTPLNAIIDPPAPLLLLRVMKSDVAAGLKPGQAEEMFQRDPAWQTNGQWGLIQFVK